MNPFLDKFASLKTEIKLGILAGVVVAIIAAVYFMAITPNQEALAKEQKTLAEKKQKFASMDAIARDYPSYKAQLEKLQQELGEAMKQLPNSSEIPEMLTQVANLAKQSGLEVTNFGRSTDVPKEFYAEVPVNMAVEGPYHSIARFFQEVSDEERIINIRTLEFKKSTRQSSGAMTNLKYDSPETRIAAKFLVVTYRFLSSSEIQAEQAKNAPKAPAAPPPPRPKGGE